MVGSGCVARVSEPLDRLVGLVAVPFSALSAPVVVTTLLYWLVIRLQWLRAIGLEPFREDAVEHVKGLVMPTIVIVAVLALPIATAVRDTVRPWRPRPLGHDAAAGLVASRSGPTGRRLIGIPLGALLLALFSVEVMLAIPGVFTLLTRAMFQIDMGLALRVVAVIVVIGALLSLLIDVAAALGASHGDRATSSVAPSSSMAPQAGGTGGGDDGPGRPLALAGVGIGGLVLGGIALSAVVGRIAGEPEPDVADGRLGPLSDGHLLGTDFLGARRAPPGGLERLGDGAERRSARCGGHRGRPGGGHHRPVGTAGRRRHRGPGR